MQVFGRAGKDMLGVIKETGVRLDETMVKLHKWGLIVSEEDAKAADLFDDQLKELQLRLSGIARVIGTQTLLAFSVSLCLLTLR
ncbi:MAG: hypothetical protein H0V18_06290 [Pyrinomonadaceae bacterium]|jgi:hypothetical protein|nr:hypothetical protein [Pyrinomonadaceae bacterium]